MPGFVPNNAMITHVQRRMGRFRAGNMFLCVAVALIATAAWTAAQAAEDKVAWMLQTNALEKTVTVSAGLPNVLVLGDSISIGYTPFLRKRLAGVANVMRPKKNCAATQFYLRKRGGMRDWVGTNRWNVIVVNCGIWDFCYMKGDPLKTDHYWRPNKEEEKLPPLERGTAIRARGFHVRTPIPEYAENLKTILSYLKSTGATVFFALTTPCPSYQHDDRCGLARAYNEVAAYVCKGLSVPTIDLYAVGERNYDHQPDHCHYDDVGNDALAECICAEVKRALGKR